MKNRATIRYILLSSLAFAAFSVQAGGELTVYSARQEQLIKPIFEAYEAATGVKVRFITDRDAALIERRAAEGANTPADVLITVDAGNLWLAKNRGVLAAIDSETLRQKIPAHLRDEEGHWFGVSLRARPIMRHATKVGANEIQRYEDLADPKWKGRLCLRTSKNVYNQSLVAMMLAELGPQRTEEVLRGWVANLAAPPHPNDTAVLEAIAAGQCDVGIANTYYLGRLIAKNPEFPVRVVWPNQADRGAHVNVSGVGMVKHAKHPEEAKRFIEWLTTPAAQEPFAAVNHEFPVVPGTPLSPIVARWGEFKASTTPLSKAGERQREAVELMDRVGWR